MIGYAAIATDPIAAQGGAPLPSVINASAAQVSATGLPASVTTGAAIIATLGQIAATGLNATIVTSTATLVSCVSARSDATGLPASIQLGRPLPIATPHQTYRGMPRSRIYWGRP